MKRLMCSVLRQERAIVTFWFWSVVFIADFLSLTCMWFCFLFRLIWCYLKKKMYFPVNNVLQKKKIVLCCRLGDAIGKGENEFGNDSPLRHWKICSTRSQCFFLCTVAWSTLGLSSIQGILFDSPQLKRRVKSVSFGFQRSKFTLE